MASDRLLNCARGRWHHARRQCRWRERQRQKVTHQGFMSPCDSATVGSHTEVDTDAPAAIGLRPPQAERLLERSFSGLGIMGAPRGATPVGLSG